MKPFVAPSSFAIFSLACSTPPFEESNKEREKKEKNKRGMKTKKVHY